MGRRKQSGSELVEFAVVLPALAMLLLVVGQVAGAVGTHQVLENAVREGARLAVEPGELGQITEIQNRVIAYAAASNLTLTAGEITVSQNESVGADGLPASLVSASYVYPISPLLGANMTLGASVEMRNQY